MVSALKKFSLCFFEAAQTFTIGMDTLWNNSFRLFHETQFSAYFITFILISRNSCKYVKKNPRQTIISKMNSKKSLVLSLLLIEYIFSKNTAKQKTKGKRNAKVKPWLKNRLHTSAFNIIFAELIVNDT